MSAQRKTVLLFVSGLIAAVLPFLIETSIFGYHSPSAGLTLTGLIFVVVGVHVASRQLRLQHRSLLNNKILIAAIGTAIGGLLLILFSSFKFLQSI